MTPQEELRRLLAEDPGGAAGVAGYEFVAYSADSGRVLRNCREVMAVVLGQRADEWPSSDSWRELLPLWFVDVCGPELTREEADRQLAWLRSLPAKQQVAAEDAMPWSLSEWLEWLRPSERTWYWLGADASDQQELRVWVDVPGHPSPTGAVEWLLKASGATTVERNPWGWF
jgi:hypothetical protein